jgi:outer membrane protein TolC
VFDKFAVVQSSAKLIVKQPLVRGFGKDVALAQQTKGDLAATEATVKTQLAAEEMLRDLVTSYWELAYAAYEVDTRAESLELAKKQEELTRIELRAKTTSEAGLTAVLYEVQIREEALLTAKNQWEKKSMDLRKRAGLELDRRDLVMRPQDTFEAADDEWDAGEVLSRARKSNRRMASLVLQKRSADVDVKVAKNSMLPKVDLELSGALTGSGDTTDRSLTAVANSNGYEVTAGLTVQFDIGGAAKGAHDAALARRQKVDVDLADAARTLDTEVVHAVHEVKSGPRARRVRREGDAVRRGERQGGARPVPGQAAHQLRRHAAPDRARQRAAPSRPRDRRLPPRRRQRAVPRRVPPRAVPRQRPSPRDQALIASCG